MRLQRRALSGGHAAQAGSPCQRSLHSPCLTPGAESPQEAALAWWDAGSIDRPPKVAGRDRRLVRVEASTATGRGMHHGSIFMVVNTMHRCTHSRVRA